MSNNQKVLQNVMILQTTSVNPFTFSLLKTVLSGDNCHIILPAPI